MSRKLPDVCQLAVEAALDKKAQKVLVLDVRGLCDYTSYIMICHGEVQPQVQAIADAILEKLKDHTELHHLEGYPQGRWIVLDYYDLIVHIFEEDLRYYYQLESFWVEVPHWWFRPDGTPILMEPEPVESHPLS